MLTMVRWDGMMKFVFRVNVVFRSSKNANREVGGSGENHQDAIEMRVPFPALLCRDLSGKHK
jgi:hypothetical protein